VIPQNNGDCRGSARGRNRFQVRIARFAKLARMAIWRDAFPLEQVKEHSRDTLISHLGIEFVEAGDDYLKARMPVDARTQQPARMLHGGASVALAETLASWAATFVVDREKNYCVGLEINANHVRAVGTGFVTGTARPVHLGRSTQIWEVRIVDDADRLVCVSRVTMAVLATANRYGNTPG
jgi:1,4-dihydroxy-2-naphthoyl-CoA hydrolase